MRLSIIIPVYNVADYLSECLDSVFAQDLTDCEVICVNDGSTDKSVDILLHYAVEHPEMVLVERENGGLSAARNTGLEVAKGEYIYFLDSDDYLYPNVIKEMSSFVDKYMLEVACFNVLKNGISGYFDPNYQNEAVVTGTDFCSCFFEKYNFYYPAPVWMYVYNHQFLVDNNLIFKEEFVHEDEEFTPRVLFYAKRIALLNIPIQYHRIGRDGAITSKTTIKHISDSTEICRSLYEFYQSQNNVDILYYHSIFFLYLLTLKKACKSKLAGKRNLYFNKFDNLIMLKSAQTKFEQKCARLAKLNIDFMCMYYDNKLPKLITKIINRIL